MAGAERDDRVDFERDVAMAAGRPSPTYRQVAETLADRDTLNLGCGVLPVEGAVNHDRWKHADHVDVWFDLDKSVWPIPDDRFVRVIGLDVFEHLRADIDVWLRECWRILKDDGELVIRVAAWNNPVSYRDPTHRKVFHEETFHYFDPRTELWANYGRIYFPDGPWFYVDMVERGNADPRYPNRGDICVVMRKAPRPEAMKP